MRGRGRGPYPSPSAGDVYRVVLLGRGHEQKGERLVIVVQSSEAEVLSTRLCVPTSSSAIPAGWRVQVTIAGAETLALVEQLRAISNEQLDPRRFVGRIQPSELAAIRTAAAQLLGSL